MSIRTIIGDCRTILPTLPADSVHCVVTSPPYWGLRDYGTAKWDGGDPECGHKAPLGGGFANAALGDRPEIAADKVIRRQQQYRDVCGKCGARRIDSQIGLEPTYQAFIAEMVAVFREVRRVLRKDGTCWVNLGDSYAASQYGSGGGWAKAPAADGIMRNDRSLMNPIKLNHGLKPKDLCGIPWRVALALQADGWWLRQDIIWSKPNPMPESVTDRCTKSHEYLFLLTKSARYYFDSCAISETAIRAGEVPGGSKKHCADTVNDMRIRQGLDLHSKHQVNETRNKRSVWEIATAPFSEAHFATFPPALVEPCIKAGCPKDGTVLDPFGGAGTTGLVADRLQRNAILIELNPKYAEMARNRIYDDAPLFAEAAE